MREMSDYKRCIKEGHALTARHFVFVKCVMINKTAEMLFRRDLCACGVAHNGYEFADVGSVTE